MAENIGDTATEQQEAAIAEHIGAHRPLQHVGREPEFGLDGGEGDADGGNVHGVEEVGGAEQEQSQPGDASDLGRGHRNYPFRTAGVATGGSRRTAEGAEIDDLQSILQIDSRHARYHWQ